MQGPRNKAVLGYRFWFAVPGCSTRSEFQKVNHGAHSGSIQACKAACSVVGL